MISSFSQNYTRFPLVCCCAKILIDFGGNVIDDVSYYEVFEERARIDNENELLVYLHRFLNRSQVSADQSSNIANPLVAKTILAFFGVDEQKEIMSSPFCSTEEKSERSFAKTRNEPKN